MYKYNIAYSCSHCQYARCSAYCRFLQLKIVFLEVGIFCFLMKKMLRTLTAMNNACKFHLFSHYPQVSYFCSFEKQRCQLFLENSYRLTTSILPIIQYFESEKNFTVTILIQFPGSSDKSVKHPTGEINVMPLSQILKMYVYLYVSKKNYHAEQHTNLLQFLSYIKRHLCQQVHLLI